MGFAKADFPREMANSIAGVEIARNVLEGKAPGCQPPIASSCLTYSGSTEVHSSEFEQG